MVSKFEVMPTTTLPSEASNDSSDRNESNNILSAYYSFKSIQDQMTMDIAEMADRNQDRLSLLRQYLQDLSIRRPDSVPTTELQEAESLYNEFEFVRLGEPTSLTDLTQRYCSLTSQLVVFSKRAVERLRIGCFWLASETVAPSVATSHGDDCIPRYLLRAQKESLDAKCSYDPDIGITSAKVYLTESASLVRTTEEYQQHLRFHCNGDYGSSGPTSWISLSDNPSWIVDQVPRYRWRSTGHKIAIIDTDRMKEMGIPFARSSHLVLEAGLQQWRAHHNYAEEVDTNVVKYSTSSHWLVFAWIPAECIIWAELEEFVIAHQSARRSSVSAPSAEAVLQEVLTAREVASTEDDGGNPSDAAINDIGNALGRLQIANLDVPNQEILSEATVTETELRETIRSDYSSTRTTTAEVHSHSRSMLAPVLTSQAEQTVFMTTQRTEASTQTTATDAHFLARLTAGSSLGRPPARNRIRVRLPVTVPAIMVQNSVPR